MIKQFFIFYFILSCFFCFSQKNEKFPSYFGFQFKPLIPGDFLAKSVLTVTNESFQGKFSQKYGYSFGVSTRVGLTELISIETGINQVKRNYQVDFNLKDSSLSGSTTFGIVSFDIPLNAMIYIKLSEKIYSNASLGGSFVYYPSNIGKTIAVDNKIVFSAEGRRNKRFDAELNANLGFELRTQKNGFFYIGTSAKVPFAYIYKVAAVYKFPATSSVSATGNINGAYLSMDFRYFLPNNKNNTPKQIEGPIIH